MRITDWLTWEAMRGAHPDWWVRVECDGKKYVVACGGCAHKITLVETYINNRYADDSQTTARWSLWMSPDYPAPPFMYGEPRRCDHCGRY